MILQSRSRRLLYAFADESGQRGYSPRSSQCFVMAAVAYRHDDEQHVHALLDDMRRHTSRKPSQVLKWLNLTHEQRLYVVQRLAAADFLLGSAVVVCKQGIPAEVRLADEDKAYLYTYRFLLERLSWLAGSEGCELRCTIAHVIRFKTDKLTDYHGRLRAMRTSIRWEHCPEATRIDQPNRLQCLQLGDQLAGAVARAFEPDRYGNCEPRYLYELLPLLRRRRQGRRLTSYGLKIHPLNDTTRERYRWLERIGRAEHEIPA
jgi:hypothetical protein